MTPSPTSTPIPTPTLTPLPGPKAGHWEGEPTVSFEIGIDGNINSFKMEIALGSNSTCTVTLDKIEVEANGTFKSIFGESVVEGGNTIQGKFESDSVVSGSYSQGIFCVDPSGQAIFSVLAGDTTWNAEWKGQ